MTELMKKLDSALRNQFNQEDAKEQLKLLREAIEDILYSKDIKLENMPGSKKEKLFECTYPYE